MRRGQQGREGILRSVDAPCVRIGKEPRTAEAATAVDKRISICSRKNLQRLTQASIKAAGFFQYENERHEKRAPEQHTQGRTYTPGQGEWRCQAIVLVLSVGLRCLSGRSRRIRKSPGGDSCRSFRVRALKSTRNRGDVWASLQSPCGLHRSLPVEGQRSFSWKPKTPSGRCASWSLSLLRRRPLSTLGSEGRCTSSSVAISHSCRAQQEANSFSLGGRRSRRRRRNHRRWRGPSPTLSKTGRVKQKRR